MLFKSCALIAEPETKTGATVSTSVTLYKCISTPLAGAELKTTFVFEME